MNGFLRGLLPWYPFFRNTRRTVSGCKSFCTANASSEVSAGALFCGCCSTFLRSNRRSLSFSRDGWSTCSMPVYDSPFSTALNNACYSGPASLDNVCDLRIRVSFTVKTNDHLTHINTCFFSDMITFTPFFGQFYFKFQHFKTTTRSLDATSCT